MAVISNMCQSQRMRAEAAIRREVEANVRERNEKAVPINWRFTTQGARRKRARIIGVS
ncbi:MAG: hypothetical protein ACREVK_05800 [Gammaproteobacteria bacterium]